MMKVQQIELLADLPAVRFLCFTIEHGQTEADAWAYYESKRDHAPVGVWQYRNTVLFGIYYECPRCGGETKKQGDLCRGCLPL